MKRTMCMAIVIVAVCCFASLSFAASTQFKKFPSKEQCWTLESLDSGYYDGGNILLDFKNSGMKIKTIKGVQKIYHVAGSIGYSPEGGNYSMSGTAYIDIGTENLGEGHLSGGGVNGFTTCYFYFRRNNGNFDLYCREQDEASSSGYRTTSVPCNTLSMY